MTLLEYILGNYEKDSPEEKFSKIISENYRDTFNPDDFDERFNGVANYKPIKTNMSIIAKNYIDSYDINDSDKDYVYNKFIETYDTIADKASININAIIDGIIDELEFDDDDETDSDDAFDDDEVTCDDDSEIEYCEF